MLKNKSSWTDKILPSVMEYCTYLFVLLMFAGKFGTFRDIGLYLPPFIWLLKYILTKRVDIEWKEPLFISVIMLSLSALITSFLSATPLNSLFLFKKEYLKIILLYLVISTTFCSIEKLKRLALFMAYTGILYLLFSVCKIAATLIKAGFIDYSETRYPSTILLFFLSFILLQNIYNNGIKRVLWGMPLIGSVAQILLAGVRGNWLGLFGALCIWVYFLKGISKKSLIILKTGVPVITAIIIIFFILFPAQYKFVKKHATQKIQISVRIEAWKLFLTLSKEQFLLGHGLDDKAMVDHYMESYKSINGSYPSGEKAQSPHNQFIKVLYQQGIIGLILYVLLFIILTYRIIRKFLLDRRSDFAFIGIAIVSTVIGEYVISCMAAERSLIPLGLIVGMAGAFLKTSNKETACNESYLPSS